MSKRGFFIVFEGCEGSGKSTQAKLLYRKLKSRPMQVVITGEPGGTLIGNKIRDFLKRAGNNISPLSELLLFNASRSQLTQDVINPGLDNGIAVICDRYVYSTIAYQGYGRGLDLTVIETVNRLAMGGNNPDLVVLLDINPINGLERKTQNNSDRFELEEIDFHRRVRQGYVDQFKANVSSWIMIDAALPKLEIHQIILNKLADLLTGV